MIKLYYVDTMEMFRPSKYVFAKNELDALNYIYTGNVSIGHRKDNKYTVEYMRDSYVFVEVDEVEIKEGLVL